MPQKLCSQKPHSIDSLTDRDIRLLPDAGLEPPQHPRWRSPQHQSTASSKRLTQRIPTKTAQHESSRLELFRKKGVLRNFTKFTGKHLCQGLFFNKVAGLRQALTEHLRWPLLTAENLLKTCSYDFKSLTSFLRNVSRLNRIAQQNIPLYSDQIYLLNDVSFNISDLKFLPLLMT